MASWIGQQSRVKGFSESKILFVAHQLRRSFRKWDRFPEGTVIRRVRRFVQSSYAEVGVYLGSRMLLDKEPLDPLSLPPNQYQSFISTVEEIFPSVRFVVMVRNPIAMVSSVVNRNWGYSIQGKEPVSRDVKEGIASWQQAARLTARVCQRENVYVCKFEDLTGSPHEESEKIADFLDLQNWKAFRPRETSEISLGHAQRQQVWKETIDCRQELGEVGIHYSSENAPAPQPNE
jgi:hypothetical protein